MLHFWVATLVLLASAQAMAACGNASKTSSSSSSVTPNATSVPLVTVSVASGKPLTRAEWIAQGDAICARLNAHLNAVHIALAAELPRVLPQEAAYEREEVAQLAKLVPPAAEAHDWQEFLNASLQWAEGSLKLTQYAKLGDALPRAPLAITILHIRAHLAAIANRDGLKACGVS